MSNTTFNINRSLGVTGGAPDSTRILLVIAIFAALALWNSVEVLVQICFAFKRYQGLYFWSLLVASFSTLPYTVGFLVKYLTSSPSWIGLFLLTIGWWGMVTGQSVVLWSRLHLVLDTYRGLQILRLTGWMITINALVLHVPTSVLTWINNIEETPDTVRAYNVYEKVQMTGFFLQEMILSTLYLHSTAHMLRASPRDRVRRLLYQVAAVNIVIMAGDISLLGIEYGNLYIEETMWKPVLYSLKLKLEFAVLTKLAQFSRSGSQATQQQRGVASNVARSYSVDDEYIGSPTVVPTYPNTPTSLYFATGAYRPRESQEHRSASVVGKTSELRIKSPRFTQNPRSGAYGHDSDAYNLATLENRGAEVSNGVFARQDEMLPDHAK